MICDISYGVLCAAQGHGAKGQNEYGFSLEFLSPVKPEVCTHFKISIHFTPLLLIPSGSADCE